MAKKDKNKNSFYDFSRKIYILDDVYTLSFEHENGIVTHILLQKNAEKEQFSFENVADFMHFLSKIDKKEDEFLCIWVWKTRDFTAFLHKYTVIDEFPRDEKFYRFYQIFENNIIFQSCDKFATETPEDLHEFMLEKKKQAGHVASIQMTSSRETRKWLLKKIYRETIFEDTGKKWTDRTLFEWFDYLRIETLSQWGLLRAAVGGGFNSIKENYRCKKVGPVQIWDILSMYISMMVTMKLPFRVNERFQVMTIEEFMHKCSTEQYQGVAWLSAEKFRLRDNIDIPTLTIKHEDFRKYLHYDRRNKKNKNNVEHENGMIYFSKELTIPVTSWDLKWILRCYKGRMVLTNGIIYECRYLPKFYVDALLDLFQSKAQQLKKLLKLLAKILLNGCSGAWAQLNINYESWRIFEKGSWRKMTAAEEKAKEQEYLDDYNKSKDENGRRIKKVGHISWYCMLMGKCRYRVAKAAINNKSCFYGDTDSNFSDGDETWYYENLNAKWVEELVTNFQRRGIDIVKAYDANKRRFLGEWTCEEWDYAKVVKRKVYAKQRKEWNKEKEEYEDKITLVCSGLSSAKVSEEHTEAEKYLEEHGGLDAFDELFVFPAAVTNRVQRIPLTEGGYVLSGDSYIVGVTDTMDTEL